MIWELPNSAGYKSLTGKVPRSISIALLLIMHVTPKLKALANLSSSVPYEGLVSKFPPYRRIGITGVSNDTNCVHGSWQCLSKAPSDKEIKGM